MALTSNVTKENHGPKNWRVGPTPPIGKPKNYNIHGLKARAKGTRFRPQLKPPLVNDVDPIPSASSKPPSLVAISRMLAYRPTNVILSGTQLRLEQILAVARDGAVVKFTLEPKVRNRIEACFRHMMQDIEQGIPVYGCNSGYGAQAGVVINSGSGAERLEAARAISRAISIVDVGVGPCFQPDVVRAAILIRINMLLTGFSAVKLADLDCYRLLLNGGITPLVAQYGGLADC